MSISKTDHGTIDVQVGAELYTLAFNLKAVKRIERTLGGILPAMQEVQKFRVDACALVIMAGANLTLKPKEVEALEEEIYTSAIINVTPSLIEYLGALLNPEAKTEEQLEAAAEEAKKTPKK